MLLKRYYKRDATAESIDPARVFPNGDAGVIEADGHLKIIDRAKDVGKPREWRHFAPNYLENKLKFFSRPSKEAVVFGDKRKMVCCLYQHRDGVSRQAGPSGAASLMQVIPTLPLNPPYIQLIKKSASNRSNAELPAKKKVHWRLPRFIGS